MLDCLTTFLTPFYNHMVDQTDAPSPDTVFKCTNYVNCELLIHPSIFFSELSQRISDNISIINNNPMLSKCNKSAITEIEDLGKKLSNGSLQDDANNATKYDANTPLQ